MGNEFDNEESRRANHGECVWMLAGVVDYKLCDRRFDCDSCPFDQAFRDAAHFQANNRQFPSKPAGADFPGYRLAPMLFYHPAHLWARIEDQGIVRVGLDDFAQSLTGRIYAVDLPAEGSRVDGTGSCWRVAHQAGATALYSPVNGAVQRVNFQLTARPSLINRDPYGEGWAFVIRPERLEDCLKNLYYGHKAAFWYRNDIRRLRQAVIDSLSTSSIGMTLPDGGSQVGDFTSLLTADQMRRLINSFLSVPDAGAKVPALVEAQGR